MGSTFHMPSGTRTIVPCSVCSFHRCAVLSAESRAGQYDDTEIELAVAHLHGMLEALAHESARS
jgi:hypothetical protein